jgi:hypothetical protein
MPETPGMFPMGWAALAFMAFFIPGIHGILSSWHLVLIRP